MRIYLEKELGEHCVSLDDGAKVFQRIFPELEKGSSVELDFRGVRSVLTPFLNASFGKLLQSFGKEKVMTGVALRNISEEYLLRINQFLDRKDEELTQNDDREFLQEMFDDDGLTDTTL